jgi:hypothetical protein
MTKRQIETLKRRIASAGVEIGSWNPDSGVITLLRAGKTVAWGVGSDFCSALTDAADAVAGQLKDSTV